MKNQIFVRNMPYDLTTKELQQHFAPFGDIIEVIIVTERDTKRSRGFGFITFAAEASAKVAIEAMDGQTVRGRCLQVSLARPLIKKSASPSALKPTKSLTTT